MSEQTFEGALAIFMDAFCGQDGQFASNNITEKLRALECNTEIEDRLVAEGMSVLQYHRKLLVEIARETLLELDQNYFERINDVYFSRLEQAGKICLSPSLRGMFVGIIACAPQKTSPSKFIAVLNKRAKLCGELLANLNVDPVVEVDRLGVPLRRRLEELEAYCLSEVKKLRPLARKGDQASPTLPFILEGLFLIFARANGSFTIRDLGIGEFEGPFVDFLSVAWEAIPKKYLTASATVTSFVRTAVKLNRAWKRNGAGFH
jgi:hypothetical protein